MAAVIRVKRRYNEEPSNVLFIACKKSKTVEDGGAENANDAEPVTAVVKFAGTIKDQDEDAIKHLAKTVKKNELEESYKKHIVDIKDILRTKIINNSTQNRYKIVNRYRSLDLSNSEEPENNMTVIDIEDSLSCSIPTKEDSGMVDNFVYDLYYTDHGVINLDDDVLFIHGIEQEELVYDYEKNEEPEYSSDDSNSESKWNDYPDSEEDENEEEDEDSNYLCAGIKKCVLNDDYEGAELDSDSSIDDFIYSVDKNDVERFGYKYAKYKALMKKNCATGNYSQNNELEFDFEGIDESISNDESDNNSNSDDSFDH